MFVLRKAEKDMDANPKRKLNRKNCARWRKLPVCKKTVQWPVWGPVWSCVDLHLAQVKDAC